jgi:hypothetical protein
MQPVHGGPEMLLRQGCYFALEGAGLSSEVDCEIGFRNHGADRRRLQREADRRWPETEQAQTRGDGHGKSLPRNRNPQLIAA